MKKFLYYLAIAASFISVLMIGTYILAVLDFTGTFPMLIVVSLTFGTAKLTAASLKDWANSKTDKAEQRSVDSAS